MTPPRRSATSRLVEVVPERLTGWVGRFAGSHGPLEAVVEGRALLLWAPDGARAALEVPWPPLAGGWGAAALDPAAVDGAALDPAAVDSVPRGGVRVDVDTAVAALVSHAAEPRTTLLLLVRRGGFAVGTARDGELLDHRTGTRHVQSRTAAGGWSQQRYARRRTGQADALVGAAADVVVAVHARAPSAPEVLVVGGDRPLLAAVLEDPRLARVAHLPRGPLLDVTDPRLDVLTTAASRARAVRVQVAS